MKKQMASLLGLLLAPLLALLAPTAAAQPNDFDDLQMNGMAAFVQLRKEYYIGALYLESLSTDADAVTEMSGRKRMSIRISADRWPPLRFAQQWNQAILINNSSQALNANVMDVLAFTSLPKDDLVTGDRLTIDLLPDVGTRVTLNDTPILQTRSGALFQLLLNTWVGPRPSTSDFKRDMLKLSTDSTATELLTRYESLEPDAARRKLVAGWGGKVETIAAATAAAETAASDQRPGPEENTRVVGRSAPAAAPASAPAEASTTAIAAPVVSAPVIAGPTAVNAPSTPEPQRPAEKPTVAAVPAPAASAAPRAAAPAPAPAPTPQKPVVAAAAEVEAVDQQALHAAYSNLLRKKIYAGLSYPRRAIQKDIEGLVVLRVNSDRSGKLIAAEVAQGAHTLLDRAAQEATTSAAPFPAVEAAMTGERFEFMIPIVFKLSE